MAKKEQKVIVLREKIVHEKDSKLGLLVALYGDPQ